MIRLITFDLDNTLAKLGKGITDEDCRLLREIESEGTQIAICSGKPADYLCGFMRQVELERPILAGENGAVIQFGVELPPKQFYILPYSEASRKSIAFFAQKIKARYPQMWFQPNLVGLTPFPAREEEFDGIEACIRENKQELRDVQVYRHVDSFDIVPAGIDKKQGMDFLGRLLGIGPGETAAVGDGVNDYPMFAYAGYAVGIKVKEAEKVDINFSTSTDALKHLLACIQTEKNRENIAGEE